MAEPLIKVTTDRLDRFDIEAGMPVAAWRVEAIDPETGKRVPLPDDLGVDFRGLDRGKDGSVVLRGNPGALLAVFRKGILPALQEKGFVGESPEVRALVNRKAGKAAELASRREKLLGSLKGVLGENDPLGRALGNVQKFIGTYDEDAIRSRMEENKEKADALKGDEGAAAEMDSLLKRAASGQAALDRLQWLKGVEGALKEIVGTEEDRKYAQALSAAYEKIFGTMKATKEQKLARLRQALEKSDLPRHWKERFMADALEGKPFDAGKLTSKAKNVLRLLSAAGIDFDDYGRLIVDDSPIDLGNDYPAEERKKMDILRDRLATLGYKDKGEQDAILNGLGLAMFGLPFRMEKLVDTQGGNTYRSGQLEEALRGNDGLQGLYNYIVKGAARSVPRFKGGSMVMESSPYGDKYGVPARVWRQTTVDLPFLGNEAEPEMKALIRAATDPETGKLNFNKMDDIMSRAYSGLSERRQMLPLASGKERPFFGYDDIMKFPTLLKSAAGLYAGSRVRSGMDKPQKGKLSKSNSGIISSRQMGEGSDLWTSSILGNGFYANAPLELRNRLEEAAEALSSGSYIFDLENPDDGQLREVIRHYNKGLRKAAEERAAKEIRGKASEDDPFVRQRELGGNRADYRHLDASSRRGIIDQAYKDFTRNKVYARRLERMFGDALGEVSPEKGRLDFSPYARESFSRMKRSGELDELAARYMTRELWKAASTAPAYEFFSPSRNPKNYDGLINFIAEQVAGVPPIRNPEEPSGEKMAEEDLFAQKAIMEIARNSGLIPPYLAEMLSRPKEAPVEAETAGDFQDERAREAAAGAEARHAQLDAHLNQGGHSPEERERIGEARDAAREAADASKRLAEAESKIGSGSLAEAEWERRRKALRGDDA